MSSLNKPQPTLEEGINTMRDNILRTQSQCNTASITSFDNCVEQLKIFVGQINAQSAEIIRLQELCKKNKIDFAIPPAATVAPHPTTQEITNPPKPKNSKD